MSKCNLAYFLFCYTRFKAKYLEIISLLISIIGGIITFFGLSGIPFYIDSNIYKIIYIINIPSFFVIILLNIIFLFFRYYDRINNELNNLSYGLSVVEIYFDLFGIIINLINDALIISNIQYYNELSKKKKSSKYPLITPKQKLYIEIVLPIILFIWINLILMALSDNLLINLKINDSYHKYELALEDEDNFNKNKDKENSKDSNSTEPETNNKVNKNIDKNDNNKKNVKKENDMNNNEINKNNNIVTNDKKSRKHVISDLTDSKFAFNDDDNNNNNNLKENLKQNEEMKN